MLSHPPTHKHILSYNFTFFFFFFCFPTPSTLQKILNQTNLFFSHLYAIKINKTVPKYPTDTKSHKQEWIKSPKQKDIYEAYACIYSRDREREVADRGTMENRESISLVWIVGLWLKGERYWWQALVCFCANLRALWTSVCV